MKASMEDKIVTIALEGRIDSGNSTEIENRINSIIEENAPESVVLDANDLEYISSAGLRVILRLRKRFPDLTITNVIPEVFEIFEMTGFTEMMKIEKAYRRVSVEGCEVIGHGANGMIYRIDKDNVVKVYKNADALEDIQHEREVAKLALILGIPTAISYDVVRVGDSYGSVFELLNARSFSKILAEEPEKMDWCVREYVDMLKKIHGTLVPKGDLPDIKDTVNGWVDFMKDYLPEEPWKKLKALVDRFDILHLNASDSHGGYLMDTGEKRERFLNDNPWARAHMTLDHQPGPETNFIYGGVHMDRAALDRDDVSIMDFAYLLNMELGDFFTFAPTDARGIDFFPAHVSKATGIRHVMEYYDVWRSEIMAYGDAMNDYEIMRMVGHPIAMGNALYGLKQVCERVIETNLEHGVQKDMARILADLEAGGDGIIGFGARA